MDEIIFIDKDGKERMKLTGEKLIMDEKLNKLKEKKKKEKKVEDDKNDKS